MHTGTPPPTRILEAPPAHVGHRWQERKNLRTVKERSLGVGAAFELNKD